MFQQPGLVVLKNSRVSWQVAVVAGSCGSSRGCGSNRRSGGDSLQHIVSSIVVVDTFQ